MIKDFFSKKENVFMILVSLACLAFVIVGFVLLFFRHDSEVGPRTIPNSVSEIIWTEFKSELISNRLQYPEYMYIGEQKEESGVGITVAEFEPREFLTYFSNQNHVSIYPGGIDAPFFYAKTRESDFTSSSGQEYFRTEFLTMQDGVWAVMLVPKVQFENWQSRGFIWIQSRIGERNDMCMSNSGLVVDSVDCDPYSGQKTVYSGTVSDQFIRVGYEIVNKNTFK
jgi:hypothetical protein